jgi:hypothetical protein
MHSRLRLTTGSEDHRSASDTFSSTDSGRRPERARPSSERYALRTRRNPLWAWFVILFGWIGILIVLGVLAILFSAKALVATVQLCHALTRR